jgi:hypothetical protein
MQVQPHQAVPRPGAWGEPSLACSAARWAGGAFGAQPGDFDELDFGLEALPARDLIDQIENALRFRFRDAATRLAGQEDRPPMFAMLVAAAGEISVLAFQSMDNARIEKGIDRPVDRDWRQPRPLDRQAVENVVGTDGTIGRCNLGKNLLTQVREPEIAVRKYGTGPSDGVGKTHPRNGRA